MANKSRERLTSWLDKSLQTLLQYRYKLHLFIHSFYIGKCLHICSVTSHAEWFCAFSNAYAVRIFLGYELLLGELRVWIGARSKNEIPMLTACQGAGVALNCSRSDKCRVAGQGARVGGANHFGD